jgi:hypothetical protein
VSVFAFGLNFLSKDAPGLISHAGSGVPAEHSARDFGCRCCVLR